MVNAMHCCNFYGLCGWGSRARGKGRGLGNTFYDDDDNDVGVEVSSCRLKSKHGMTVKNLI